MSFSAEIKEELSKIANLADKECVKAEIVGYLLSNNTNVLKNKIKYTTENEHNINRFNKLLTNLNIDYKIEIQGKTYVITLKKQEFENIIYEENIIKIKEEKINIKNNDKIYKAIVRGAFLGSGLLNNPNNKYHLEILFSCRENLKYILNILKEFRIQAKELKRKNSYSLYMKEAEEISKILALIGANRAVIKFEEIRVVRQTRSEINRIINCETANLNKTINASIEQIEAIKYIKKKRKFEELPNNLKEIAILRLNNPDTNLKELGQMLKEPLGKSRSKPQIKENLPNSRGIKRKKIVN